MWLTAVFTSNGDPATGLSPTVTVYNLLDNSIAVNAASMTEVGSGFYKYDFSTYDSKNDYAVLFDAGATATVDSRYTFSGTTSQPEIAAIYDRLGAPTGASIAADIAAVPTAAENRAEMDANSTKLANLDAAVSSRAAQTSVDAIKTVVDALQALAVNKKEFVNEVGVTYLVVYDTDGTTPLYKWPYKDSTGADITLDDIGKMAKQLASVI